MADEGADRVEGLAYCAASASKAFPTDTAAYSQAEHDATLRNIDQFFGQVVSADEVITCWPPVLAAAR